MNACTYLQRTDDPRWTLSYEWVGHTRRQWVIRYCGTWRGYL